jgi:hypothetical protein
VHVEVGKEDGTAMAVDVNTVIEPFVTDEAVNSHVPPRRLL